MRISWRLVPTGYTADDRTPTQTLLWVSVINITQPRFHEVRLPRTAITRKKDQRPYCNKVYFLWNMILSTSLLNAHPGIRSIVLSPVPNDYIIPLWYVNLTTSLLSEILIYSWTMSTKPEWLRRPLEL